MVRATSLAKAAISIASTPSEINSPAPDPTMPTPRTRSVAGSMTSLVKPSIRSMVTARPEAPQGNFAVRFAPDRNQYSVENFFPFFHIRTVEAHANSVGFLFHSCHRSVEHDGIENRFHTFVERKNQIAVSARQEAAGHFNHGDFRA